MTCWVRPAIASCGLLGSSGFHDAKLPCPHRFATRGHGASVARKRRPPPGSRPWRTLPQHLVDPGLPSRPRRLVGGQHVGSMRSETCSFGAAGAGDRPCSSVGRPAAGWRLADRADAGSLASVHLGRHHVVESSGVAPGGNSSFGSVGIGAPFLSLAVRRLTSDQPRAERRHDGGDDPARSTGRQRADDPDGAAWGVSENTAFWLQSARRSRRNRSRAAEYQRPLRSS